MTAAAPVRPSRGEEPPARSADPVPAHDERADLSLLTDPPNAVGIVQDALAGTGPPPTGLRVDVVAVHHRPGLGVSVCYEVAHDGAPAPEVLVASTAAPGEHDRTDAVATLDDGVRTVRVWRRADDPALPGLRPAMDAEVVAGWLGRTDPPVLELLGYRPTRRAVLAARFVDRTVFLKVVRPHRAASLLRRHALLAGSTVPGPRVLGEPVPGAVVLAAADGMSLAQALAGRVPAELPTPEAVVAALDALPPEVARLSRRPSWVDRLDFHATAASSARPERAALVKHLQARIAAVLGDRGSEQVVPTHGDLNVANLFVRDGAPSALIDVDSVGPGRRADDLATLLAHLAVLPALAPTEYADVPELAARWRTAFAALVDPAELDARTAAVLISLVAGAADDQADARLDLAEDLMRGRWPA